MSELFDVSEEVILVTGASQGLGRQFARVLSAQGAAVALAARQTDKLKNLQDEIVGQGGRAVVVQMDVTDTASIGSAIDHAEAALGPISVLINNAGIAIEKLAVDQTEEDWDAVINANLKRASAGRQYRQYRLGARLWRDEVSLALHDFEGGNRAGHQGDGAGIGRQPHSRQCAGARLYRYRDQPRLLVDGGGREAHQADSAASRRLRIRSRRGDPAARVECFPLHDRQRYHCGWRLSADLKVSAVCALFPPVAFMGGFSAAHLWQGHLALKGRQNLKKGSFGAFQSSLAKAVLR